MLDPYLIRIQKSLDELGISAVQFVHRLLPIFYEPEQFVSIGSGFDGREYFLLPRAAEAWRKISAAAGKDGINLFVASAYRSLEHQADIIRRKLSLGLSLDEILSSSAPPGYSEHHSGRAVDIATLGCPPFEEEFENTDAFLWMSLNAKSYGFTLSFARENKYGYVYEPWHWYYRTIG